MRDVDVGLQIHHVRHQLVGCRPEVLAIVLIAFKVPELVEEVEVVVIEVVVVVVEAVVVVAVVAVVVVVVVSCGSKYR